MKYVGYKNLSENLRQREEFKGSRYRSEISDKETFIINREVVEVYTYDVYSFNTLILKIRDNEVLIFDNDFYSNTTSKLQNIIIDTFNLNNRRRKRN